MTPLTRALLFALFCLAATPLDAQTVEIKLVNGRTGRPMVKAFVNVWVGSERKERNGDSHR